MSESTPVLDPREKMILDLRLGINGSPVRTLYQIALLLKISRKRVSQLQDRALKKLGIAGIRIKKQVLPGQAAKDVVCDGMRTFEISGGSEVVQRILEALTKADIKPYEPPKPYMVDGCTA